MGDEGISGFMNANCATQRTSFFDGCDRLSVESGQLIELNVPAFFDECD